MAGPTVDLRALDLRPGEVRRTELKLPQAPLRMGGQEYVVDPPVLRAWLDLQGVPGGVYLKLRFEADVRGPCFRCLDDAAVHVVVKATEYHESGGGEELRSDYVDDEELHAEAWARDALVFALPPKILCRPECVGLCPRCGVRLEEGVEHSCGEEEADPRWEKLRSLRDSGVEIDHL
jgi:uncharacterized protein